MSPGTATGDDRRIRSLRPAKPRVDPWSPLGAIVEEERTPKGAIESVLTIFLAGSECPFTCVFCDLWRYTLDERTPAGSLPAQIEAALESVEGDPAAVKLYNASNFFDPRAVPNEDIEAIVRLVEPFARVVVESHPLLIGERCQELAEALGGRLEVAMGLESARADVLERLNKKMTLADFDRAAARLRSLGVGMRAFVLVGAPFLRLEEQVDWAVRSVEYAATRGVGHVALIPVRGGNGEMERLADEGEWQPPTLEMLEETLERSLATAGTVVAADTWDLERFASCADCRDERLARIERMNLSGEIVPRHLCEICG